MAQHIGEFQQNSATTDVQYELTMAAKKKRKKKEKKRMKKWKKQQKKIARLKADLRLEKKKRKMDAQYFKKCLEQEQDKGELKAYRQFFSLLGKKAHPALFESLIELREEDYSVRDAK